MINYTTSTVFSLVMTLKYFYSNQQATCTDFWLVALKYNLYFTYFYSKIFREIDQRFKNETKRCNNMKKLLFLSQKNHNVIKVYKFI